ncbi:histidine N-alpha-methyltransferase-like [Argopecten irradians]|uniref:histidine N-alpha-methyltransferase-like n=1 Tax=Argopecten irradians TaxID=31199 RepID=UPI003721D5E7
MDMKKVLVTGLTSTPKYLPGWYRYDNEGSRLNDLCLHENENYYFHRCELSVMKTHLQNIIPVDTENTILVDLGSGNCHKARLFIDEILKRHKNLSFYPVDISHEFLLDVCKQLADEYGTKLVINPIGADYEAGIAEISKCYQSKVILWFGSIQNLEPGDQIRKLQLLRSAMTG